MHDAARLILRTMGRTNFPLTIRHDQAPNLASDIIDALYQMVGSVACKTVPHVHHTNPMAGPRFRQVQEPLWGQSPC